MNDFKTISARFLLLGALAAILPAPTEAQIEPVTEEFFIGAAGTLPAVATDSRSLYLVAWWSYRAGGSPTFVRFVDADGMPLGAKQRVSSNVQGGGPPRVAANVAGRFAVAWRGNYGLDIVGSVYDSLDEARWRPFKAVDADDFLARTGFYPLEVDVALLPDGELGLAWSTIRDVFGRVYNLVLDASASPVGVPRPFGPREATGPAPQIGVDDTRGELVVLRERTLRPRAIIAQRYTPEGAFLGPRIGVYTSNPFGGGLGMAPGGGFVAAWMERTSRWSARRGVFFQRHDRAGAPLGEPVTVTEQAGGVIHHESYEVLPLVDSTGRVVVVWQSGDGHLKARAFDPHNEPLGETTILVDNPRRDGATAPPLYPDAALGDDGRLFVVWDSRTEPGLQHAILGRIFEVTSSP